MAAITSRRRRAVKYFSMCRPASGAPGWIEQLAAAEITRGCGNGNYCPFRDVTRAEMAVFLVRTFERGKCVDDRFTIAVHEVVSNPGDHPTDDMAGEWEHFCSDGLLQIIQTSGNLNPSWECLIGTDGSCSGSGICSIGGNTTMCSFDSFVVDFDWSGTMIGGTDGNLPGGQTIELTFGHP